MNVEVIDLFCGVGGLTRGLIDSGLNVIAGFDIDPTCRYAYEKNNLIKYHESDICKISYKEINSLFSKDSLRVLVGCAPCQPFSKMRFKMGVSNASDEKYNLLLEYGRIIKEVKPEIISMENVPYIENTDVFKKFLRILRKIDYNLDYKVIDCPDYGIPQSRRRFILLGSLIGDIKIIPPTHKNKEVTVYKYIGGLRPIKDGETDKNDPLHRCAGLSKINKKRIINSKPGGTWNDWPYELRCNCHKKESGKTYSSVYGRMSWDKIGPTITTQFFSYGTGRYGHPEQDRALSLREGALLQTFPDWYDFIDPDKNYVMTDVARHIGNAVPVRLGQVIGESIVQHLEYK